MIGHPIMLVPQIFCTKGFLASPGACVVASPVACVVASPGACVVASLGSCDASFVV